MSTFGGKIEEIHGISIDRFDGENLQSKAFFLSHCHTDHMQGLRTDEFEKYLCENHLYLYLSPISGEIVKKLSPQLVDNIKTLELHTPSVIFFGENESVSVTLIPAGHCPGSVMFLFETEAQNVLYTGDYRINPSDIEKIKAFYDFTNAKKRIDALYLDTTFFLKDYAKFPLREESLQEVCRIIENCLKKDCQVTLNVSGKYGYEFLFLEIYKKFKIQIHVNDEIFDFCSRIPALDQTITKNANTKIHSLYCNRFGKCCETLTRKEIKISSCRWKNSDLLEKGIKEFDSGKHFVCYSYHASYEEILQFLKFLQPSKIYPNVITPETEFEIGRNIEEFFDMKPAKKPKLFEIKDQKSVEEQNEIFDEISSKILDSPPTNTFF